MENNLEKICPICKQQITNDEKITICKECGTTYHESCWQNNNGCITCSKASINNDTSTNNSDFAESDSRNPNINKNDNNSNQKICSKCGIALEDDQAFCPNCGTPKELKCYKCGTVILDGQAFCPNCGRKVKHNTNSKKGNKILIAVVASVVAIALIIAGVIFLPKLIITVDTLLEQGKYVDAYNKANDEEKNKVIAENVVAYLSNQSADALKDPSSFELRDAWYSHERSAVVLYIAGKNSYGGISLSYCCYTKDTDGKYKYLASVESLEEEAENSYDDSDERREKNIDNAVRVIIKFIINSDNTELKDTSINNINKLFKEGELKNVELLEVENATSENSTDDNSI